MSGVYAVFHGQYPVTLHKTYGGAYGSVRKLVEETNMNPDNLYIRFLFISDDDNFDDAEVVN